MHLDIVFENRADEEETSYLSIPVVGEVTRNVSIGDIIGIDKTENELWVSDMIDLDDTEIKDFLRENFNDRLSVAGFIRRIIY